jgi:hypothetical protein
MELKAKQTQIAHEMIANARTMKSLGAEEDAKGLHAYATQAVFRYAGCVHG